MNAWQKPPALMFAEHVTRLLAFFPGSAILPTLKQWERRSNRY
jgi:hypothetical protein